MTRLTVPEVAERLRVSPWSVKRMIHSGVLRASKPGKQWLIDERDLDADLDATANRPRRRRRSA